MWLKDLFGKHAGECLIIGGGESAGRINAYDLIGKKVDTIITNDNLPAWAQPLYFIASDSAMERTYRKMKKPSGSKIIGPPALGGVSDLVYWFRDIGARDIENTGLKAIKACRLLGYEIIYLVGFDFYTYEDQGKTRSHFIKEEIGPGEKYETDQALKDHITSLERMIGEFEELSTEGIYNLNADSNLRAFPFFI